jgi:hypothetical protein
MTAVTAEELVVVGAPQVGVTVTDLDVASVDVSVQVSWDDGSTWRTVSGGSHVAASGGVFVRDHFAPLNVAATYRVVEHSLSGDPATEATPLTVASDVAWLQDPLDPRTGVSLVGDLFPTVEAQALILWGAAAEATWGQEIDFASVLGGDRPVASVGQRQVASSVPLRFAYEAAVEGGTFQNLLKQAGLLVLRLHRPTSLEPVAHIAADAKETVYRPGDAHQISTWDMTATQVRPLSLRLVVPWWTYAQVTELWLATDVDITYAEVAAARPGDSYLDWAKDPTP